MSIQDEQESATARRTPRVTAWLLVAAYALLLIGWIFGNPPFTAPDENHHFIRSIDAGRADLIGAEASYEPGIFQGSALDWVNQAARLVDIPPGMYSPEVNCNAAQRLVPATCQNDIVAPDRPTQEITAVGTYQPFPYLLPGLATRLIDTPIAGNYITRVASALLVLAMIGIAVFVSVRPDDVVGLWPLGLIAAITPMFVFVGSSLNPSGLEIASGLAFAAVMIRIGIDGRVPNWVWVAAGITGAVLALSRSITPLWVAILAIIPVAMLGVRRAYELIRAGGAWSLSAIALVIAGLGLNRIWELAYGPKVTFDLDPIAHTLSQSFGQYSWVMRQHVGIFGYLEATIPNIGYLTWFTLMSILLVLAFLAGSRKHRIMLVAGSAAAVVIPALLFAAIVRHTGFGVQGRHVLAVVVAVPLLAGAVLASRGGRLMELLPRTFPVWFAAGAGSVHLVAWLANARRHAVGADGPLFFFGQSAWTPPGGWAPWLFFVVAGVTALVLAAWMAIQDRQTAV